MTAETPPRRLNAFKDPAGSSSGQPDGTRSEERRRARGERSRLDPAVRRTCLVSVFFNQGERDRLAVLAELRGMSVPEFLRYAAVADRLPPPIPPVNLVQWARLGPLAADLNQYVKAIRAGRAPSAQLPMLEELRRLVAELRDALRGRAPGGAAPPEEASPPSGEPAGEPPP